MLRFETGKQDQITVGNVVRSLHEYMNACTDDIVEAVHGIADDFIDAEGNELPDLKADTPVFFEDYRLGYKTRGRPHTIYVFFFYNGSFGRTVEEFWKWRSTPVLQQPEEGL